MRVEKAWEALPPLPHNMPPCIHPCAHARMREPHASPTSWHMSDMNSLLASLAAFSRATLSARCAACACAAASWRCALMRAWGV